MSEKNKSVEEQMNTLRELVAWFESDDFVLEQAGDKFKQAAALAQQIEKDLNELKNDIAVVKKSFDQA